MSKIARQTTKGDGLRHSIAYALLAASLSGILCGFLQAADPEAPRSMKLSDVVDEAVRNYPSIRVATEQAQAAASAIALARTAYLPEANLIGQVNRATRNNVFGLLLPQPLTPFPSISGPVLGTNDNTNVWGSAVGAVVSWEPFDFGLRAANVAIAEAEKRRTDVAIQRTQFEVATLAADAYLTLLAANETLRAAQAQLARAQSVSTVVEALVKSELRPGADLSRSRADIAVAQMQVIRAEEAIRAAQANLKQFTKTEVIPATPPPVRSPAETAPAASIASHPAAREQQAVIQTEQAREHALERSYFPKFALEGTSYARGSGAFVNGQTGGAASGLGPNFQNWAIGMTVSFPVMDYASLRERRAAETHRIAAESARYQQILVELQARQDRAIAQLVSAQRIAAAIPAELEAAQASERQATARYRAGLTTLVDVADAQRVLAQAEVDEALARLNVWRALLAVTAAQGDIQPFLEQTNK